MSNQATLQSRSGGPVECLGRTFDSDETRREHYLRLLALRLRDPDFRAISGFPEGTDEAILSMSDPPYYTACPNPFLNDFVRFHGRPHDPAEDYARRPFAVDVSAGKTHAIYKAHGYHTKVPHLAIVPSILHYQPVVKVALARVCMGGSIGPCLWARRVVVGIRSLSGCRERIFPEALVTRSMSG